jgi:flagellar hook-length control protein FliK
MHHVTGRQHSVAPSHVTGQVFPEISRLVSRGDGTRRITLKLSPEALGDVRVTLTVRHGDVQVRMVGSEQAQQALRAGAPELQRLLDAAGASSSQIVVGDQGTSADAGPQNNSQNGPGADAGHTDHRTAGTRDGDTSARDGSSGRSHPRSPIDPAAIRGAVTRTRSGVDVTM